MTPARCLERLIHHADRLDQLVRLGDRVVGEGENASELACTLHREIRLELKRDYDAGDRPRLSVAETATQAALYGAYAELSPGIEARSQRMLSEASKASRILQGGIGELKRRRLP